MKEVIQTVLDKYEDFQLNLGSSTAREKLAIEISEMLQNTGKYTKFSEDEVDRQEAKKGWICQTCGKSTFETDYDYLVHPKLHLGCALEEELKGKDIKEQYHKASEDLFKETKDEG